MAAHSSVLAWTIPGTGEPGGLLSMGSHRVGHDWSDLAAAAVHTAWAKNVYWFLYEAFFGISSAVVVSDSVTSWSAEHQASLSFSLSQSLLKFMYSESVMLSNHLILCYLLLFLPSIFPSIRVFSNESALCIRWPKYRSFSFSISPSNEYSGLISLTVD